MLSPDGTYLGDTCCPPVVPGAYEAILKKADKKVGAHMLFHLYKTLMS